jgi:hypothetical protein
MTQDEAFHCLQAMFETLLRKELLDPLIYATFKTNIDYVLKSASPETVYGALHEWAKEKE